MYIGVLDMNEHYSELYFKYRTLDNFEYLLDMVIRDRLYTAPLDQLNDPMEGLINASHLVPESKHSEWAKELKKARVACFTSLENDLLMWSHYGSGGRGCFVAFRVLNESSVQKVSYEGLPTWNGEKIDKELARSFLSRKLPQWHYEEESRAILFEEHYFPIQVEYIQFGPKANPESVKLLSHIISLCRPDVGILGTSISAPVNPKSGLVIAATILEPLVDFEGCENCYRRDKKIKGISMYQKTVKDS